MSVWCCRARRAHRMRTGHAGRTGAVGLVGHVGCVRDVRGAEGRQACRRRRRSSACVAGVVTEHRAIGVGALGQVYGLSHGCGDIDDESCNNSDDDVMV